MIGFDARVMPARAARWWDAARRARYLLAPDVAMPLSVDRHVWPSWCRYAAAEWTPADHRARLVRPEGFRHRVLGLWQDRGELQRFLAVEGLADEAMIVAITLRGDALNDASWRAVLDEPGPALEPGWRLLGHDVADGAFTSALSNCGYREDERAGLARDWAGKLNAHGLFVEESDAAAFARLSDARVAAHAPFFVHALHAVA